jgi:alkanesulfonate monooxygenase SsuD/methylene tetrahydromethanopterin reductase-like flavin-dependent oxidoreductase (luciferase family)
MPKMNYGIVLGYGHPRVTAGLAQTAEAAGWDGVFVGDAIWCQDPLIQLAAAAMTTTRIRLGTMVLAMPLRDPRQLASESLALDELSNGRLILGLATGATWMGWAGFPNIPTDARTRAEMLEESIHILTQMHQSRPFDFDGKHYQVRLSQVDPMHYPPPTPQQPRVPIWIPAIWPRMKNVRRALLCDGVFPQKMNKEGALVEITPEEVRAMRETLCALRPEGAPLEVIVEGKTAGMAPTVAAEMLRQWQDAGVTWFVESTWELDPEALRKRIEAGPPAGPV